MKINLSKCDQKAPVAAVYYYDETTPLPSKKKKKKRSPKSKDTCQICADRCKDQGKHRDTQHIQLRRQGHPKLHQVREVLSAHVCCLLQAKSAAHHVHHQGVHGMPTSNVSYNAFGTGLMHTCPFCRFKTALKPLALCFLLFGSESETSETFFNDPRALESWSEGFE